MEVYWLIFKQNIFESNTNQNNYIHSAKLPKYCFFLQIGIGSLSWQPETQLQLHGSAPREGQSVREGDGLSEGALPTSEAECVETHTHSSAETIGESW